MKKVVAVLLACVMILALAACSAPAAQSNAQANNPQPTQEGSAQGNNAQAAQAKGELTFVIVPKCVHEWFDAVAYGANEGAAALSASTGINIKIDYRAPSTAEVTAQNAVLEQAAATNPDGIVLDPVDYSGGKQIIDEIQKKGIPVILFDARVPGSGLPAVGNDFSEQAELEARDLAKRIGEKGKVAIMHSVPTSANHSERYETFKKVLAEYPNIEVVEASPCQDNYQIAQQSAAATIAAHPDLVGFLCVDASGPIGISAAIEEAGKQDQITFVGAENLLQILQYIKKGTMVCSYSTKPQMQGAQAVQLLYQAHLGMELPQFVDTGILYIDSENVDEWIAIAEAGKTN